MVSSNRKQWNRASVFGGVQTERIQLNEKSLWSGGPSESRPDYKEETWKKKEETDRMIYKAAVINFLFLIGIALFYAFCHMTVVVDFKNSVTGFLHYFQIHRFYWLYPADWYLEFALAAAVLWRTKCRIPTAGCCRENW